MADWQSGKSARQSEYAEMLKDPRWREKRQDILERDERACQSCRSEGVPLEVHHRRYVWGRAPWEYDDDDLISLCRDCHEKETFILQCETDARKKRRVRVKVAAPLRESFDSLVSAKTQREQSLEMV